MEKAISFQTLQRMPIYLNYLKSIQNGSESNISAKVIADALGLGEIQVRKDLAAVSSKGRPKIGYNKNELICDIESFLGYDDVNDAVLVGAGRLGRALLSYEGFKDYGLNIVAAFDADAAKQGFDDSGKEIFPIEKLPELCRRLKIQIGIITVPADKAQEVCNTLVENGVIAIWNFAPAHIVTPDDILIKNENMAISLAILSKHLAEKIKEK